MKYLKKTTILSLIITLLTVNSNAFPVTYAQEDFNIVENGGFENGCTGWNSYGNDTLLNATTQQVRSGTNSAIVSQRTEYSSGLRQTVTLNRGRVYDCSVWIKASSGANKFTWLADSEELRWAHLVTAAPVNGNEWTKLSGEIIFDGSGDATFSARIEEIPVSGGAVTPVVYFDDFSIEPRYKATNVEIHCADMAVIPQSGTRELTPYAVVKNQVDSMLDVPQTVTWSLEDSVNGVSVDSTTGKFLVGANTALGTATIVATAYDNGRSVVGKKTISLVPNSGSATAANVTITGQDHLSIPTVGKLDFQFVAEVIRADGTREGLSQEVTWELSQSITGVSLNSEKGILTVSDTAQSATVVLRASSTEYSGASIGEIIITLLTEEDKLARVTEAISAESLTDENLNAVTGNLNLPTTGLYDSVLTWQSDKPDIVSSQGVVTRSGFDEEVTLTVNIVCGMAGGQKKVNLCVPAYKLSNSVLPHADINLINNADFEEEWNRNSFSYCKDNPQSGQQCAYIEGAQLWLNQEILVKNGVPYRLSAWIRLPDQVGTKPIVLGVQKGNGDCIWVKYMPAVKPNEWVYLEGFYTNPGDLGQESPIVLYIDTSGATNFYVDNLVISRLGKGGSTKCYTMNGGTENVSPLPSQGSFYINKQVRSNEERVEVILFAAVYDEENRLLSCTSKEETMNANEAKNIQSTLSYTDDAKCIKIMLLQDTLAPLVPVEELTICGTTYYVCQNGSDEAAGTNDSPFATINKAAQLLQAGDTCIIREGVYRETIIPAHSGTKSNPITYMAYPGEEVVISGADEKVLTWEAEEGTVYKATSNERINQLFVNGRSMNVARFPNTGVDLLLDRNNLATMSAADYSYLQNDVLPTGDLNGVRVHLWPGDGWNAFEKTATRPSGGNTLYFDNPFAPNVEDEYHDWDPFKPKVGNKFYLYGKRALLDVKEEWVQEGNMVYLWTAQGDSPLNHKIEVKTREWAFDIYGKSNITIKGIDTFAAAIRLEMTESCVIDYCNLLYQGYSISTDSLENSNIKSTILQGRNNIIKNSKIMHTMGDGVVLSGTNNRVYNCIINDVDSYGDRFSPVRINGTGNQVLKSTLFNTGGDIVYHSGSQKTLIAYNEMYNGGMLAKDLGATYAWNTDGAGTVIAYNKIHDMNGQVGIYLDCFCENVTIHHNLIYNVGTGILLNSDSLDNLAYNNTMSNVQASFLTFAYTGYTPSQKGSRVINNIITGRHTFVTGVENEPYVANNITELVSAPYFLPQDARAREKGVAISGITDGFTGRAPDIGAFEFGTPKWTAGANITNTNTALR